VITSLVLPNRVLAICFTQ